MEANIMARTNTVAPPPSTTQAGRPAAVNTDSRPAAPSREASPAGQTNTANVVTPARPAPVASAPSLADLNPSSSVDLLSAHSNARPGATEALVIADIPLPYGSEDVSENVLNRYMQSVNDALAPSNFRLNFNVHEATSRVMVTVVDTETDEILREIPPESRLELMARIQEFSGILFDQTS